MKLEMLCFLKRDTEKIHCPVCGNIIEITPRDLLETFGSLFVYCNNCDLRIQIETAPD